jgi:carboxymethylenebutenolidase
MIDQQIDIATTDGKTTTFITHPERGGPFPVIILYMDAPAIREELRDMARRLATSGYYVMLPNLYYRSGVMELGPLSRDPASPDRKRMFELMESLSIDGIMDDAASLLAFAAQDAAAETGRVGAIGYCMSGQYAINAAARFPEQVKAAASIYGVRLVTEAANSPHKVATPTGAELYFACAETDHWAPLEMVETLRDTLKADGARAEVELYPGVEHGFAFPQRPVYDKPAAERHWERVLALFKRNLG